ncbi:DUF1553 domain-containing protein [Planctomicrobium sp. SH661]|uniref:DUF1553 domain-containing protein n=1 Tax=Planctomicrobium sp. SH661 TaxID=3448124 RepID=UPI003F5B6742
MSCRGFTVSRRFSRAVAAAGLVVSCVLGLATLSRADDQVKPLDFARDIKPILSNHCWNCHGPDGGSREAGLRLDLRESATAKLDSDETAVVPGHPELSELIKRVETTDDNLRMPPASTQKSLSPTQIDLLKRWIAEGARYSEHWAFQSPRRPDLPKVAATAWPRNPIDHFVLKTLEDTGLAPSPAADRATWLRRVTLDLTGVSPTPDELAAFLTDNSPEAEEKVVDRLLSSSRHAERMAMQWLDAARYADTNGYNNDEVRTMWPWRDWLIDAFAQGMPYDQFLTEQLAGDMIPQATHAQKVATGFNRNHVITTEGGIIPEEYRVEYVADRIHTTATVFLGLSLQCARCHDHKFDPLTQREYYQFAALLNNVPDNHVNYSQGKLAEPLLKVPSREQQLEQYRLTARRDELTSLISQRAEHVDADIANWEKSLTPFERSNAGTAGLVAYFLLDEPDGEVAHDSINSGQSGIIKGQLSRAPGRVGNSVEFDGSTWIDAGDIGKFEGDEKFSLAAWVFPTSTDPSTVMSRMDEANSFRGYDVILEEGKVATHLIHHWPDRGFKVISEQPVSLSEWHHIVVTYDGSREAKGVRIYVDGVSVPVQITTDRPLDGTLVTDKPFHIGRRFSSAPFRGKIDEVQAFSVALTADEVKELAAETSLTRLADVLMAPAEDRTPQQVARLRQYYLDQVDPLMRQWKEEQELNQGELDKLDKAIPAVMVMEEMTPRRVTHLLNRGQYDQPGEVVSAGVPAVLSGGKSVEVSDRMALAKWLTDPSHPLTARVAVNRWWEMTFGTGLVETSEDFGVQGMLPSHPELLDWLALELIEQDWNYREILKLIVLSATYRQSSDVTPALLERDPHNRLLARGSRYRLPVEVVRDNALAISGLLSDRVGGPSVMPYQPAGLWEEVSVERRDKYTPDTGEGLYRRSMYTFWKRTCPPPSMTVFDAPDRETCLVRRARTNTPLQALVLLNDPTYVEASRKFAERAMGQSSKDSSRLDSAFQLALSRSPEASEQEMLLEMIEDCRQQFTADPQGAEQLLAIGQSPRNSELAPADLAAWTVVCSMILNLDETISKR